MTPGKKHTNISIVQTKYYIQSFLVKVLKPYGSFCNSLIKFTARFLEDAVYSKHYE